MIDSFEEPVNQFSAQFASSMKIIKVANHLLITIQGKYETFKVYTQHFNKENVRISNCNDSVVEAFWNGLNRDNLLYDFLKKTKPETMIDAMSRAIKYIKLEKEQRLERKEMSKSVKIGMPKMELAEPLTIPRSRQEVAKPFKFQL